MKRMNLRTIYVSLTSLALVFSLAGCNRTSTTQPESRNVQTGQSQVRQIPEEKPMGTQSTNKTGLDRMTAAGKTGFQDLSQKAEQGFERIATSSNDALKGIGMQTGYGDVEKKQFLTGCKQSCAKESPKTSNVGKFCELYCGCTHDNLQNKVSFEDLQDYTVGKATDNSNRKIEQIRSQCVKDAHTAVPQAPKS